MPQLPKAEVKARAGRLREAGDAARDAWLEARVGRTERVVMETEFRGRTETFAEAELAAPQAPGGILEVRVEGRSGARLLATPAP
jgi:threonylcarbamoyladenosine tRNA methylthiotransferase MtaB